MTQKYLGILAALMKGPLMFACRNMKQVQELQRINMVNSLAAALEISPEALTVPDIDSYIGLIHTLFVLEDLYGLKINNIDGKLCLTLDKSKGSSYLSMFEMFRAWHKEFDSLKAGEITKNEYDTWRYNYPKIAAEQSGTSRDIKMEEIKND